MFSLFQNVDNVEGTFRGNLNFQSLRILFHNVAIVLSHHHLRWANMVKQENHWYIRTLFKLIETLWSILTKTKAVALIRNVRICMQVRNHWSFKSRNMNGHRIKLPIEKINDMIWVVKEESRDQHWLSQWYTRHIYIDESDWSA